MKVCPSIRGINSEGREKGEKKKKKKTQKKMYLITSPTQEAALNSHSMKPVPVLDRLLSVTSRHSASFLLFTVCCVVAVIGVFVIRDLKARSEEHTSELQSLRHLV